MDILLLITKFRQKKKTSLLLLLKGMSFLFSFNISSEKSNPYYSIILSIF